MSKIKITCLPLFYKVAESPPGGSIVYEYFMGIDKGMSPRVEPGDPSPAEILLQNILALVCYRAMLSYIKDKFKLL